MPSCTLIKVLLELLLVPSWDPQGPAHIQSLLCYSKAYKHLLHPNPAYAIWMLLKPWGPRASPPIQMLFLPIWGLLPSKSCSCHLGSIPTQLMVQGFLLPFKFCSCQPDAHKFLLPSNSCSCHLGTIPTNQRPMVSCSYPNIAAAIYVQFLPTYDPYVSATVPTKDVSRSYSCHLDPTLATMRWKNSCSYLNFAQTI